MENNAEQYYFKVFTFIQSLQSMLGHKILIRIIELVDSTQEKSTNKPDGSALAIANAVEDELDLRSQYEQQFLQEIQAKRYEQLKYYFQSKTNTNPSVEIQDIKQVKTRQGIPLKDGFKILEEEAIKDK